MMATKPKPDEQTVFVRLDLPADIHRRLKTHAAILKSKIPDTVAHLLNLMLPAYKLPTMPKGPKGAK